jgi:hypothetical protein
MIRSQSMASGTLTTRRMPAALIQSLSGPASAAARSASAKVAARSVTSRCAGTSPARGSTGTMSPPYTL